VLLTTYPLISSHTHNGDDTLQSYQTFCQTMILKQVLWPTEKQKQIPLIQCYKRVKRKATYIVCNNEAHSQKHCCCGKAISITYS